MRSWHRRKSVETASLRPCNADASNNPAQNPTHSSTGNSAWNAANKSHSTARISNRHNDSATFLPEQNREYGAITRVELQLARNAFRFLGDADLIIACRQTSQPEASISLHSRPVGLAAQNETRLHRGPFECPAPLVHRRSDDFCAPAKRPPLVFHVDPDRARGRAGMAYDFSPMGFYVDPQIVACPELFVWSRASDQIVRLARIP